MKTKQTLFCKKTSWHGRNGFTLSNGVVRLVTLTGGGHIAEFHLEDKPSVSPLWVPPWKTIEPHQYKEKIHKKTYGTITEGKLLSGIVGHNICLDYFGSPSVEEAKLGLSQHGEAPWSKWNRRKLTKASGKLTFEMAVRLPVAGLQFSRQIELREKESVVYFRETVRNERKADHFFHWTQHVTLGPQFLSSDSASIALPGSRSLTYPHGYDEGRALLTSNEEFVWPNAPLASGGTANLTRPFLEQGLGFVVAILLDKKKDIGFIAASNPDLGLLIGYCFKRADFPWVAIWEENQGIEAVPWKKRTQARGLEFSSTPLPVLRREAFLAGRLFDEPTLSCVPARGTKTVQYLSFLAKIPKDFGAVKNIDLVPGQIIVRGSQDVKVSVAASGLHDLLG
ncbi:MAG TPA: hypothetical protein VLK33_17470 [Terriglobales bacterium]|nr:hypothetical protein [Terriglobales bacterium]